MSVDGHRPVNHPILRQLALRDEFDDLHIPRGSLLEEQVEEQDPALGDTAIDLLALCVARLHLPLSVGQRVRLRVIATELERLGEGPER